LQQIIPRNRADALTATEPDGKKCPLTAVTQVIGGGSKVGVMKLYWKLRRAGDLSALFARFLPCRWWKSSDRCKFEDSTSSDKIT